jgi:hypothetical protein
LHRIEIMTLKIFTLFENNCLAIKIIIFLLHSLNAKGDFVLTLALGKRHPKDSEPDYAEASNSGCDTSI